MLKVHVFCFWFSVRLGSVIVGVLSLAHASTLLCVFSLYLSGDESITKWFDDYIDNIDINKQILQYISMDNTSFATFLVVFLSLFAGSCIALLIGALQCNFLLLCPFMLFDFFFIVLMTSQHIFFMLTMKDHDSDLGHLIFYCNLGVFIILYYIYMWICVVSFGRIIEDLKMTVEGKKRSNNRQKIFWVSPVK